MKRVVLDTNVLAAAFRSRSGASFRILQIVALRQITPLLTTALLLEYESVLKRPEQTSIHRLPPSRIDEAVEDIAALSEAVDIYYRWRPQLSDPKDELVLEAAVNGRADALVTHNVRDFEPAAKQFGLRILRPGELLEHLKT
ncbi:putative toxin-antitoxin system toxin component, PIN family [Neorhizobium tomejilense]|uniref:putative toxin-antitoxin system toxin component, PIN family n=1 Tax=Neorhizobium tomejilense TaxID=2093828 RepID=UPI000CF85480|nr:putative toxin-antitoxin system toxin component, PIN family [Neorhizobium tomejilense]